MIKHLRNTIAVIFLAMLLLIACSKTGTIQPLPSVDNTITPIVVPSPTRTAVPPTSTPITAEEANLACIPNQVIKRWEISPNGAWMTRGFYLDDEKGNLLHVVSLDCMKNWKIYLSDYKEKDSNAPHDDIIPYRWSKDGKFLYAIVGQRMSVCCRIGGRYVLLVRLDLETGEQTAILNSDWVFDFIISDSDRHIVFTPPAKQSYDFAVLDFETQKTQEVTLRFKEDIDLIYAVMSPGEDKIVLPLFKNIEYDYFYVDSTALIDLATGKQELLVSGLTQQKELYPVRWVDESHVLLSNVDPKIDQNSQSTTEYWLLDIASHKLEKAEKP